MLDISTDAVKQHLAAIFTKIGAANRSEAVSIALRKHLLKI
jgi:DNA-binding CsgD family transcriptional regulator